ncbi:ARPP-1 family domain-containing protein [Nocardioides sp. CPCC 205120]|uniref:ARPP-1 family domain-containing protein n=1 Tax=Nocardioides sp. CPCC 205120 TaxID=3406462 RepID=UPI003B506800
MRLHLGDGTTAGAITIFPVWHDQPVAARRGYDTTRASLAITELPGGAHVPRLQVGNAGSRPALLLEGQLLEGGLQHRMAVTSTLVGARTQVGIDVMCVEEGRWHGGATQTTSGRRAPTYVTRAAALGQHEVWRRVGNLDAGSPTRSLVERYDAPRPPQDAADALLRRVRPLAGQTGVLVGVGGQPLTLEVFDHPRTLAEQLAPIVRGAALDALLGPAEPTPGRRARRMLERLRRVDVARRPGDAVDRGASPQLDVMVLRAGAGTRRALHLRTTYLRHPTLLAA